jgi:hypothetical protein
VLLQLGQDAGVQKVRTWCLFIWKKRKHVTGQKRDCEKKEERKEEDSKIPTGQLKLFSPGLRSMAGGTKNLFKFCFEIEWFISDRGCLGLSQQIIRIGNDLYFPNS